MSKAKERLDAEATHPMTTKQKLDNFWFYYKWIVLGSVVGVVLVATFVIDMINNVKPDYQVAMLTPNFVTDETRAALEASIVPFADDSNGDGKTVVSVVVYQMPVGDETPSDPNTHMANVTKLSADLQMAESIIFITDAYEEYQQQYDIFLGNGATVADCPAFAEFMAAPRLETFGELRLCRRTIDPVQLEKKEELALRKVAADELFIKLTED